MKTTKKVLSALFAGALAFGMMGVAGCSNDESDSGVPEEITTEDINAQDINVTASGYTIMPDAMAEGVLMVNYAFTIENPNDGYIANGVTFTVEGYDENDIMLIGGGETVSQVYPNTETGVAGISYLSEGSGAIARFEVTPLMENVTWTKTDLTTEEIDSMFQITDTAVNVNEEGTAVVTGTVSTDLGQDESEDAEGSLTSQMVTAHAVALLKDASGNILCGGTSSSIMLDPSMVPISSTPETGGPTAGEGSQADEAYDAGSTENNQVASTQFTISIANAPAYSNCYILVTPGI